MTAVVWLRRQWEELKEARPAWPILAAMGAGIALIIPITFGYARHVGHSDWAASAGAACGGWLCLVLLAVTAWQCFQIWRFGRDPEVFGDEAGLWRPEFRTAILLVAGLLLGWKYFK